MYHWREVTISRGLSPFSKKFVMRWVARGAPSISPDACAASTTALRAENAVAPVMASNSSRPRSEVIQSAPSAPPVIRPLRPRTARVGRSSSRHHCTSVRSPKVQHMAMPEPLSISAAGCARTGTSTSNTGVRTVVPNSGW